MKCKLIAPLLAEYEEGTISPENRKFVEEHLAFCKQCTHDAQLIAEAFTELREVADDTVPANYFSGLVPRIHERLEHRRNIFKEWKTSLIPGWLEELLAPASALAVVASLIAFFFIFEPSSVDVSSPLKSIVAEVQARDANALSDFIISQNTAQPSFNVEQHELETASDPELVAQHFENQLLPADVEDISTSVSYTSSDQSYESLSSDEVDQVIQRLSRQTIL